MSVFLLSHFLLINFLEMEQIEKNSFEFAITGSVYFFEATEELDLFDLQQAFINLAFLFEMLFSFCRFIMVLWIVKHSRAQAIFPFLAHQNIIVHTTFATCPEFFILC